MVASGAVEDKRARRWKESPWNRESPEWLQLGGRLPLDDPAWAVDQFVEMLDVAPFLETYAGRGKPPDHPRLMLKIVLYECHLGRHSPKEWNRDARFNDVCKWLGMGIHPSRSTWYAFAKRVRPWVEQWNAQMLSLAQQSGMTPAERAALDGTTIGANSSRHRLVGAPKTEERLAALRAAVQADQAHQEVTVAGCWMAETPAGRVKQLRQYERLQRALERRQQENARRPKSERKPPEKIKLSLGDPEAPLGRDKSKVFRPLYNVEILRDLDSQLILAYEVFDQTSENGTARTMLDRHETFTGKKLQVGLGDAKFVCGVDLAEYQKAGVLFYGRDQEEAAAGTRSKRSPGKPKQLPKSAFVWLGDLQTYRCPEGYAMTLRGTRQLHYAGGIEVTTRIYRCSAELCRACPRQPECTTNLKTGREIIRSEHEPLTEALRARMATPEGQALYRLRGQTVELSFADLLEHRGLRQFVSRGLAAARAEIGLAVLVHNGLALIRHLERSPAPTHPAQVPR